MKYLIALLVLSFVVYVAPGKYPCQGRSYRVQDGPKKGQYTCILKSTGWISPGY